MTRALDAALILLGFFLGKFWGKEWPALGPAPHCPECSSAPASERMCHEVFDAKSQVSADPARDEVLRAIRNKTSDDTVELVPISRLVMRDSLRSSGEDDDHIRTLTETGGRVPPILVQRATMAVVDGMHRVRASIARGETAIQVHFFDGDDREAYALAVKLNSAHGLPLSRGDRNLAVEHLIKMWPEWSNNTIAFFADVSPKLVAERRRSLGAGRWQAPIRRGRDGRMRPLSTEDQRRHAYRLFQEKPTSTLREIAKQTGLSMGTVRDVRLRYESGRDPVPDRQRLDRAPSATRRPPEPGAGIPALPRQRTGSEQPRADVVHHLRNDPVLRLTRAGRFFLRLLDPVTMKPELWHAVATSLPAHLREAAADAAVQCAESWLAFGAAIQNHRPDSGEAPDRHPEPAAGVSPPWL